MRQNKHSLSPFPKFNKEVFIRHQREKHWGVILPLGESDCLDWQNDKDNIHGLA